MKVLSHLRQQCKKNNKGASLVTVLMIAALVMLLITVLISMTLINYYMKNANAKSQANFYDAESAMEEIRLGLSDDVTKVAATTYVDVLNSYSSLDGLQKNTAFSSQFKKALKEQIQESSGSKYYSIEHLTSFFRDTAYNEENKTGAEIITPDNTNYININDGNLVLKNIRITYTDAEGYVTQLQSDIVISCPEVDFTETSGIENILNYGVIANDSIKAIGSNSSITGNAYLGKNDSDLQTTSFTFDSNGDARGYVVGGGQLTENTNCNISVDNMEVWLKNLVLNNSSSFDTTDSALYLQNDLVLGTQSKISLAGELIAFGNVESAKNAQSVKEQNVQVEDNPGEYSSSLIISGKDSQLDLSGLNQMYIAGRSYINTNESNKLKTGQSLTIKSDQRAYLVPLSLVGVGKNEGGANPINSSQYDKLRQEIANEKYSGSIGKVTHQDIVSFDLKDKSLGKSLSELGVVDYQECYMQVTNNSSIVYLFMIFDSDASANAYYRLYNSKTQNYDRLLNNLDFYTSNYGIKLPDKDIQNNASFYFGGNLLTTSTDYVIVNDKLDEYIQGQATQEQDYQDSFAALNKKLVTTYKSLSKDEKAKDVFHNVIDTDKMSNKKEYYVATNGDAAVVVDGDYTYYDSSFNEVQSVKDANGIAHNPWTNNGTYAQIKLIIATGNVKVVSDFKGLIIAGGQVMFYNGGNIVANPTSAAMAMMAKSYVEPWETNKTASSPADYIKDAKSYLIGGDNSDNEEDSGDGSVMNFLKCITYENWKKQ